MEVAEEGSPRGAGRGAARRAIRRAPGRDPFPRPVPARRASRIECREVPRPRVARLFTRGSVESGLERSMRVKYRVLIEEDEDGVFVAEVPALPGCVSQGDTRAEALQNVREAIEGYLESLKAHDEPIPPAIEEELVDVAV